MQLWRLPASSKTSKTSSTVPIQPLVNAASIYQVDKRHVSALQELYIPTQTYIYLMIH